MNVTKLVSELLALKYLQNFSFWWPGLEAYTGYWKLILKLDEIQRSFTVTRLTDGIGLFPYSERLRSFQLTTLLERRMRGDLTETFKITFAKVHYGIYSEFHAVGQRFRKTGVVMESSPT